MFIQGVRFWTPGLSHDLLDAYSRVMPDFPLTSALRLIVAAALVRPDGRVLLQKRPQGKAMAGLWEFPGGKIEPSESPEQALARELTEELGISVSIPDMAPMAFASEAQGDAHMLLLLYIVRKWEGEPQALEAEALKWLSVNEMHDWPMPPADIPLVAALKRVI